MRTIVTNVHDATLVRPVVGAPDASTAQRLPRRVPAGSRFLVSIVSGVITTGSSRNSSSVCRHTSDAGLARREHHLLRAGDLGRRTSASRRNNPSGGHELGVELGNVPDAAPRGVREPSRRGRSSPGGRGVRSSSPVATGSPSARARTGRDDDLGPHHLVDVEAVALAPAARPRRPRGRGRPRTARAPAQVVRTPRTSADHPSVSPRRIAEPHRTRGAALRTERAERSRGSGARSEPGQAIAEQR